MSNHLQEKAMLVNLSISAWTASKKDGKVSEAVKSQNAAAGKSGWFNKRLVDPSALQPIGQVEGRLRSMHYRFTLAWGDNGDRILPAAAFFDYTEQLRALKTEHESAVEDFVRAYPALIQSARGMLGAMYDPADYPDIGTIRGRFGVKTFFTPVPDAADFRVDVGAEAVETIRKSITESLNSRLLGATRDCWLRLDEVLRALGERLSDPDAVFRDSLLENVRVVVDLLPKLNVAGDLKLLHACADTKRHVLGYTADTLRHNKQFRADVVSATATLLREIAPWIATPTTQM